MMHWIILPVVLPAMLAPFIVLAARYHIGIQRVISIVGSVFDRDFVRVWRGKPLMARHAVPTG